MQGLQPGGVPLEISSQGLVVSIVPPPDPEEEDQVLVPIYWTPKIVKTDCRIEVLGVTARLTATTANIAAQMPTIEELDERNDLACCDELNRRIEEQNEEAAEEAAHRRFMLRWNGAQQLRAERRRRQVFRQCARDLGKEMRSAPNFAEDMAGIVLLLRNELAELREQVAKLTKAKRKK